MKRLVLSVLLAACALGACDSVPIDDTRAGNRLFPARGVIRGTVSYTGPRPCSQGGHIVGSAILLVFDAANPPPPAGLAVTAVNFATVPGDVLFPNEPRSAGPERYCPAEHGGTSTVATSAPYAIAPLDAGSYVLEGFYDASGDFFPTFKFESLPEKGDVGGGYIDTADAAKHLGDVNYQPIFLPIAISPGGDVADGVPVTLGATIPLTRPYFHPDGADAPDPSGAPIATMPQDVHVLAQPADPIQTAVDAFQASFTSLTLDWGVAPEELALATDPAQPFKMQLPPSGGGLLVWSRGVSIPETAGASIQVPQMWPMIVLSKLDEDASPDGLVPQGSATKPIVIIQAITLWQDSLLQSALFPPKTTPGAANVVDHVRALVRPSVVCFDPRDIAQGGVLATPYFTGKSAEDPSGPDVPLFDPDALRRAQGKVLRDVRRGCLPTGKYGINLVYPTGQAWTVPNEIGACAAAEGAWDKGVNPSSCSVKRRPVLASQGARAVLEITAATSPEGQALCANDAPVPPECLKNP